MLNTDPSQLNNNPNSSALEKAMNTIVEDLAGIRAIAEKAVYGSKIAKKAEDTFDEIMGVKPKVDQGIILYSDLSPVIKSVQELAELIAMRKAANPLISNELVSVSDKAATDANEVMRLIDLKPE